MTSGEDKYKKSGTEQSGGVNTDTPQDDPGIVSAETAARKDRQGESFGDIHGAGATVDKEGISNVYPVETEPFVNQPGDVAQEEGQAKAARAEVQQTDEEGRLSGEGDTRGKGAGLV